MIARHAPVVARAWPGPSWMRTANPVSWCKVAAMPVSPAFGAISFSRRWISMIFVSVEIVDSSSALSAAIRCAVDRSAAISSSLAITVPDSCARTESRNVSSSDRASPPATIKKTGSSASGEVIGNADHEDKPPISSGRAP